MRDDLQPVASLIAVTPDGDVLMVEETDGPAVSTGYHHFPTGPITSEDEAEAAEVLGRAEAGDVAKTAALRALFAHTGLAVHGASLRPAPRPFAPEAPARAADATRIVPAGTWVTQPHSAVRVRQQLYVIEVDGPGLVRPRAGGPSAEWVAPAEVRRRWFDLETFLDPATDHALSCLELGASGAIRRLSAPPEALGEAPIANEVLRGVRQVPLLTPTLPPAAHTNAYVIGHERLIVVDPAPFDQTERDKLVEYIETLVRRGATLDRVVLTHHHHDHYGAASWVAEAFDVPVAAHANTRAHLEGRVIISQLLDEGDQIDLGLDATGSPFVLDVLFTPGHAPGHLVLVDTRPNAEAMVVGDMVAAVGTIVVDPEDGDMARYIAELRRLSALAPRRLFAAHGPPIVGGQAHLDFYVAHRLKREARVLAALERAGEATAQKLLPDAYDDTPKKLYPLAARACLAHLLKLVGDGRAVQVGRAFRATR